jgi:hypothetical protein
MIITYLVLGGLVLPHFAMWIGFLNALARIVYTIGYVWYGSNNRIIGAVAGGLPLYVLGIASLV